VLVLVKHSLPVIDPAVTPAEWRLGQEGRARCGPLGERLRIYDPKRIVSSTEPKAAETAQALGDVVSFDDRLREHDRSGIAWLGEFEFERAVGAAFARPEEVVFGRESIAAACDRFSGSVQEHLEQANETLVVVAHGTVIAAYTAAKAGVDGYTLWRRLGLPSIVVLDREELVDVVEEL
jgi:broad specificity phosphatase PhoE